MAIQTDVFMIESMLLDDELENDIEGKLLTEMLRLGGKNPLYFYVRTKRELKEILRLFEKSEYRYLHLSCHGDPRAIDTTLDSITFEELGGILKPYLCRKRLFMSSCATVNGRLARAVMKGSGCLSVSGPIKDVDVDVAAIFWASFYHLLFRKDEKPTRDQDIRDILGRVTKLFGVSTRYYGIDSSTSKGYRFKTFRVCENENMDDSMTSQSSTEKGSS